MFQIPDEVKGHVEAGEYETAAKRIADAVSNWPEPASLPQPETDRARQANAIRRAAERLGRSVPFASLAGKLSTDQARQLVTALFDRAGTEDADSVRADILCGALALGEKLDATYVGPIVAQVLRLSRTAGPLLAAADMAKGKGLSETGITVTLLSQFVPAVNQWQRLSPFLAEGEKLQADMQGQQLHIAALLLKQAAHAGKRMRQLEAKLDETQRAQDRLQFNLIETLGLFAAIITFVLSGVHVITRMEPAGAAHVLVLVALSLTGFAVLLKALFGASSGRRALWAVLAACAILLLAWATFGAVLIGWAATLGH